MKSDAPRLEVPFTINISGDSAQVDKATQQTIHSKYSIQDELKLLRRAVMALASKEDLPIEFLDYNSFVEKVVNNRKKVKQKTLLEEAEG
jgi:hypothetical protein